MNVVQQSHKVGSDGIFIDADVVVPPNARGVVLFAHGSGSSRHSPRNKYVAAELQETGLATVLADLLTHEEEIEDSRTGSLRFDIELLTSRTVSLIDWTSGYEPTADLGVGLFGASTGAGAALSAAALREDRVKAIVSRGGRPDLAGEYLHRVRRPTLLIVGGNDPHVLELNAHALDELPGEAQLIVVPRASHLFEEPGALEEVARLTRDWFVKHL